MPYRIVYNVLVDSADNYDLFIMRMDGTEKYNLTHHPDIAWTYKTCQDQILFVSDRDTCHRCYFLYEMDSTGDSIRKVYKVRLADSWMGSRFGDSQLIVRPHPSVDSAFHVITRQGELLTRVDPGLPFQMDPTFTFDGSTILFRGGEAASKQIAGFNEGIYRIQPDGSGLARLTHYPASDTSARWFEYHAGPPIPHPSGAFFSYQSSQAGKYSLYATSISGDSTWRLTDLPVEEGWHSWSPDGRWLAIEIFDPEQTQFHIALLNWETKAFQILTDTTFRYQQCPVFVMP